MPFPGGFPAMKKAVALALLTLALAGPALAAPATIKVVKDPAELP